MLAGIDPKYVPEHYAQSLLNVRLAGGKIQKRYGYRQVLQCPTEAVYGFEHLVGFVLTGDTYEDVDEYIAILQDADGKVRPFALEPDGSGFEEVMKGSTRVELDPSDWVGISFDDYAYFVNQNEKRSVKQYKLRERNSWRDVANPEAPTSRLSYHVVYGGQNTPYQHLTWVGLDPANSAHVACTGAATNTGSTLDSGQLGNINMRHLANVTGFSSIEINLNHTTFGLRDFEVNDCFQFNFGTPASSAFRVDPYSFAITFKNDAGVALTPTSVEVIETAVNSHLLKIHFYRKNREDWRRIQKILIEYRVTTSTGTAANNVLYVSPPIIGGIWMIPIGADKTANEKIRFAYSYEDNDTGFESGLGGVVEIPFSDLRGYYPGGGGGGGSGGGGGLLVADLGVHIDLTGHASPEPEVDDWRVYYSPVTDEEIWYFVGEQEIGNLLFKVRKNDGELSQPDNRHTPSAFKVDNCVGAFSHRGSVCWLYGSGNRNLRWSRVGRPLEQATDFDELDDEARGATFSLADNFGDAPVAGFSTGDAAIILGNYGAYAQIGHAPSAMTPPKVLPGSFGCAGKKACALWKDDQGNPMVVALSKAGDALYGYQVNTTFDGQTGFRVIELSLQIRDALADFLTESGAGAPVHEARVFCDTAEDSLWVVLGRRALVLRKHHVMTHFRFWEFYEYDFGLSYPKVRFTTFSIKRRHKWILSNGTVVEAEWNTETKQPITGRYRDGGNEMPQAYWQSKDYLGPNRAVMRVRVDHTFDHPLGVKVASTRKESDMKRVAEHKRFVRFSARQQGREHCFYVYLPNEGSEGEVRSLEVHESLVGGRHTE